MFDINEFVSVVSSAVARKVEALRIASSRGWEDARVEEDLFLSKTASWEQAVRALHRVGALEIALTGPGPLSVGSNAREVVEARFGARVATHVWAARAAWAATSLEERHRLGYSRW